MASNPIAELIPAQLIEVASNGSDIDADVRRIDPLSLTGRRFEALDCAGEVTAGNREFRRVTMANGQKGGAGIQFLDDEHERIRVPVQVSLDPAKRVQFIQAAVKAVGSRIVLGADIDRRIQNGRCIGIRIACAPYSVDKKFMPVVRIVPSTTHVVPSGVIDVRCMLEIDPVSNVKIYKTGCIKENIEISRCIKNVF